MTIETLSAEKANRISNLSTEPEDLPLLSCIQVEPPLPKNWKIISPLGPDIRDRQWYHGFMTRRESEILCRKHGQWLFRVTHGNQDQDSEVCFYFLDIKRDATLAKHIISVHMNADQHVSQTEN
uniref:SH2 domain-containing protein n=1 Tax=Panagrolaimus sp. ES5 TaxID=591445 RepID=A0AC34FV20_9BILA